MTGVTAAHMFGAFLMTAGLPAHLQGRVMLGRILLICGVAVAHMPDLAASLAR